MGHLDASTVSPVRQRVNRIEPDGARRRRPSSWVVASAFATEAFSGHPFGYIADFVRSEARRREVVWHPEKR